jgi:hypothetical protein
MSPPHSIITKGLRGGGGSVYILSLHPSLVQNFPQNFIFKHLYSSLEESNRASYSHKWMENVTFYPDLQRLVKQRRRYNNNNNITNNISSLETVGLRVPAQYIRDSLCSMSAIQATIVFLLDVLQLLMLFVRMLTYLEPKRFLLIMFYNCTFIINKMLIVFNINLCTYFFFHRIMVGVISLLSQRYRQPCFVFCLCACVCFVSLFACAFFINGLWTVNKQGFELNYPRGLSLLFTGLLSSLEY